MPQFRLADLDIRWTGTDSNTPAGHVTTTGFDPLGNYRVFLYEGDQPDDEHYVGSILIPKAANQPSIAYSSGGGFAGASGTEAEKLAKLVARYAATKS